MAGTDILSSLNKNGSGLNLRELATTLVTAEITPKRTVEEKRVEKAEVSISALGQVRSQFAKVQTAVAALRATPSLQVTSGSSTITPRITDRAALQDVSAVVEVQQLAQRHVLEFGGFASADATVGEGSLTVEFGVWYDEAQTQFAQNPAMTGQTLTIAAGTTLAQLAEQLSDIPGVTARVLDKGDGTFSLGIVGEVGAGRAMRFTAVEGPTAGLAALDTTVTNPAKTVQAASDAMVVVDGITLFRPTNSVTDVIPGLTLDLNAVGSATTVSVGRDKTTAKENLAFLVETVNETMTLMKTLTQRGLDGAASGDLAGDGSMDRLRQSLTSLISAPIAGYGSRAVHLADFGVATNRDGSVRLDEDVFDDRFAADPAAIDALFEDRVSAGTAGVRLGGLSSFSVTPGDYAFVRNTTTGAATLAGSDLLAGGVVDGVQSYAALSGPFFGLTITVPEDMSEATIRYGQSFLSSLDNLMAQALGSGGDITRRESQLGKVMSDSANTLTELDAKATALEQRYVSRFAAMEQVITQLKSTGSYLTNLVDSWNKDS